MLTLSEAPPPRLDKALAEVVPEDITLSRSMLVKLIEGGAVSRLSGEVVTKLKTKGQPGEMWQVRLPEPEPLTVAAENIPLDVVYEDDDLIVVNKPKGMVVHPAPGSQTGTLVNALLHHCGASLSGIGGMKRPGIVHRIDKDTSGLLVVAKSDAAHQGLAVQFAKHTIERRYTAFTHGMPRRSDPRLAGLPGVTFEAGGVIRIITHIARHKTDRKRMAVTRGAGRNAVTRLKVLNAFGPPDQPFAAQVDCRLETGRTHQIRVHAHHIGHGLIGDPVYGGRKKLPMAELSEADQEFLKSFTYQALHAAALGFIHPITGEPLEFTSDIPPDLQRLRAVLTEKSKT